MMFYMLNGWLDLVTEKQHQMVKKATNIKKKKMAFYFEKDWKLVTFGASKEF